MVKDQDSSPIGDTELRLVNQTSKPHLSPSQIDTYNTCGERYRRRYILGEKIPPGFAMAVGTSYHKTAEENFNQKITSRKDLPQETLKEIAMASFDDTVKSGVSFMPDEEARGKSIVLGEAKDRSVRLAGLFGECVAPDYQPSLVEKEIRIEVPTAPFDLLMRIDMLDEKGILPDFKTSAKKKTQEVAESSSQLTMYSAGTKFLSGQYPNELRLDVAIETKAGNLDRQILKTYRDTSDYVALTNKINAAAEGIKKEVYNPPPDGAWCCNPEYCGFFFTCHFISERRKNEAFKQFNR